MLFDVFLHAIKEHECIRGWVGKPEIEFKYSDSCLFFGTLMGSEWNTKSNSQRTSCVF